MDTKERLDKLWCVQNKNMFKGKIEVPVLNYQRHEDVWENRGIAPNIHS
jgi:hypothetical protein